MSSPYVGEIRLFAGNFAPAGWAFCAGQLMPISENDTLFNLIGTTYGGDGQETFGIPDLQGRVPVHMGRGPGISQNYQIGEKDGAESVTLNVNQIPSHTHALIVSQSTALSAIPTGHVLAQSPSVTIYEDATNTLPGDPSGDPIVQLSPSAVTQIGGNQPHENRQPVLTVSFIISLFGIYPTPT